MTKLYCDRCGKEIKDVKAGLIRHHTYYGKLIFDSLRAPADDWTSWHEICVDCEMSFMRWYNHPEVDDEN